MIYIYDILLNWTDLHLIYDFYEWDKSDTIEHIKKIPLLKVNEESLSDFMHFKIQVTSEVLEKIENMTEVYKNKKISYLSHACILSDGVRVLGVEFDDNGNLIYHSRLLLDEEEDVLDLVSRLEFQDINYTKGEEISKRGFYTRKEEEKKNYLLSEFASTYEQKDIEKLHYLYQEYFDEDENDLKVMYEKLVNSFDYFNPKHEKLYQLLQLSHTKKV